LVSWAFVKELKWTVTDSVDGSEQGYSYSRASLACKSLICFGGPDICFSELYNSYTCVIIAVCWWLAVCM